jgi:hypothetical protein
MKLFLILFLSLSNAFAAYPLILDDSIIQNKNMYFATHTNALALGVEYKQIKTLRYQVSLFTDTKLTFFKGWSSTGEAHVTFISPPEAKILLKHLTLDQMNKIALKNDILNADLQVLEVGSASGISYKGNQSTTFFLIVESQKLRFIRNEIYQAYLKEDGQAGSFDPNRFFPHITIGFTVDDLHEGNGVIKDIENSYDDRFRVILH